MSTGIEQHVSVEGVAEALDVSKRTVFRLIERGEIQPSRVGKQLRIPVGNINAYLQRRRVRSSAFASEEGSR